MSQDELSIDHVRYQQLHRGVPVTGGELIVHLKGDRVLATNGKTVSDLEEFSVEPLTEWLSRPSQES